jgi:hypothetical protein
MDYNTRKLLHILVRELDDAHLRVPVALAHSELANKELKRLQTEGVTGPELASADARYKASLDYYAACITCLDDTRKALAEAIG